MGCRDKRQKQNRLELQLCIWEDWRDWWGVDSSRTIKTHQGTVIILSIYAAVSPKNKVYNI